jgi:copper transport protein
VKRIAALAVAAGAFVVLASSTASAHALLQRSSPADGSVLQAAPKQVTITFTEPPDPKLASVQVMSSSGAQDAAGPATVVPGQPKELVVPLKPLPDGVYTVTWRVVSKTDGHTTASSFSFGVGVSANEVRGTAAKGGTLRSPPPPPAAVAGRWVLYWGLAVLLAGGVAGIVVFGARVPLAQVLLPAAWAAAVVGLVVLALAVAATAGVSLATLLGTSTGASLEREGIALLVTGGAVAFALRSPTRPSLVALAATAGITMVFHALGGHADASSPTWFNVGVQWLHMAAVGMWIGGLVLLLAWVREHSGEERAAAVRRFSWLAAFLLAIVAGTGLLREIDEVGGLGSWGRLLTTAYGVVVLVKVGLFVPLLWIAWRNRTVNVPGVSRDPARVSPLRLAVMGELALAAAIFAATGLLTELAPSATVAQAAQKPSQHQARPLVVTGHDFATSVRLRLTVTPGTVGPNRFQASVADYDTGKPVRASSIQLQFSLPGNPSVGTPMLSLSRASSGLWTGRGTVLSLFGRWSVQALIQEPGGGVQVPLTLQPKLPRQRIQVSRVKGQPTLYTIALPRGASLQAYLDPGRPGVNAIHFTFFKASGNAQPITSASATELGPTGASSSLKLIRFGSGHFVANDALKPGKWTFLISATSKDGQPYSAYFSPRVGPG